MWCTMTALAWVILVTGTTLAPAASLPIVANGEVSTPSAAERPSSPQTARSVQFATEKRVTPQLQCSEAGITWSLSPRVAFELNYERSALPPMMPRDHDDGFLTHLKIGF